MLWVPLALMMGCGGPAASSETPVTAADLSVTGEMPIGIPNEQRLESGLVVGGQPDADALNVARAVGITTVISLRTPSEPHAQDEHAQAEAVGLRHVSIPVAGVDGLTEENAQALDRALAESGPAHTLLHCGTGNRAGALLALRAFHVQGKTVDEALEIGERAGLTRLRDQVREHMQWLCQHSQDRPQCATP